MRRGLRSPALATAALLAASCTAIPRAEPAAPPPPTGYAPPPAPPPAPPAPADFALSGAVRQGGFALGIAPAGTVALTLDGENVPLAPDRRFAIGFGRDATATARLEARLSDGRLVARTLQVSPREWDIQSLPTLARGTKPSPEFLRRRNAELAQINAARAVRSQTDGWRKPFIWPATGRISGVFGSQRIYAGEPGAPHAGVDIARPTGTQVVSPGDGVVVLAAAAPFSLEGNLLIIDHGMGLNSAFLHLSRIDVKVGDRVAQGQPVGAIGMTGRATGPHLHWAMTLRGVRIDAATVAGPMPAG